MRIWTANICAQPNIFISRRLFLQKGLQAGLPALFRELRKAGMTLSLDTNDDPDDTWGGVLQELLDLVDIFLPNEDELLRMTKLSSVEEALNSLAGRVPLIVVKCGSRGAILQKGSERLPIAPVSVQPVDTIGAGDSFDAGFLSAWLRGASAEESARMGNICGALSTQRPGGTEAFRDKTLVSAFLQKHSAPVSL